MIVILLISLYITLQLYSKIKLQNYTLSFLIRRPTIKILNHVIEMKQCFDLKTVFPSHIVQ